MDLVCSAILFDLDGTLLDSAVIVQRHWEMWAAKHNLDLAQVMEVVHGRRSIEIVQLMAPHLDAAAEVLERDRIEAADIDGLRVLPGAKELLSSLPHHVWAIVTSGDRVTATTRMRFAGFAAPPILITSEDVTRGKPDPQGYLRAATLLDVMPGDCVVIEDAPAGITAAKAAGMRVVAVATTHDVEELRAADVVLPNIAALGVSEEGDSLRLQFRDLL